MFVRTASERDVAAISGLLADVWRHEDLLLGGEQRFEKSAREWVASGSLQRYLKMPSAEFLVADDGRSIAGFCCASSQDGGKLVVLAHLCVAPAARRSGIGGMLLDEALDSFPNALRFRVGIDAASVAANDLFSSRGFEPAGEQIATTFPYEGMQALVMEKRFG